MIIIINVVSLFSNAILFLISYPYFMLIDKFKVPYFPIADNQID